MHHSLASINILILQQWSQKAKDKSNEITPSSL